MLFRSLIQARVSLLMKASFFGNLATRLKLTNADEWCGTAATDGRNFYYNSRFIEMLRPKEVEFLFGHEVLHCVYDHFGRCGDRIPKVFNIAKKIRQALALFPFKIEQVKLLAISCRVRV